MESSTRSVTLKRRHLARDTDGRSNEQTTATRESVDASLEAGSYYPDNDYGFAYSQTYKGGFYYGDLRTSEGSLPQCFPEDIEC